MGENEMAHYARDCWDAEILTSYGWIECVGHAHRGCYDLTCHSKASGKSLQAKVHYNPPIIRDVLKVKPNARKMGPSFKKDAKVVSAWLKGLEVEEALQL